MQWRKPFVRMFRRSLSALEFSTAAKRPEPVLFADIVKAQVLLREELPETGFWRSHFLSRHSGCKDLYIKSELSMPSSSFKDRGARHALKNHLKRSPAGTGVMAASAGNHALALAWNGRDLGIPVTVLMPTVAPLAKVNRCRAFGAQVVMFGENIAEAQAEAQTNPEYKNLTYINGFDDHDIIAGAGTMGLEIINQIPEKVDAVVLPIGGGGLIAGAALAIKTLQPDIKVYGVEGKSCPSFQHALEAGGPDAIVANPTLADGLAVPRVGERAYGMITDNGLVDDYCVVDEKCIAIAILRCLEEEKVTVEGAGVAGLAAMLPGGPLHRVLRDKKVVVPLCGGNIDSNILGRVIDRGLAIDGRLRRFYAVITDRPGGIMKLSKACADVGASILDMQHERAWQWHGVDQVKVRVVVEVYSEEHWQSLSANLRSGNYGVIGMNEERVLASLSGTATGNPYLKATETE